MLNLQVVFITAVLVATTLQQRGPPPFSHEDLANGLIHWSNTVNGPDNLLSLKECLQSADDFAKEDYLQNLDGDLRAIKECIFDQMDEDQDGVWTLPDHTQHFQDFDQDQNGQVTDDEIRAYAEGIWPDVLDCYNGDSD